MRFSTVLMLVVGTSTSLVGLTVAAPVVADAAPASVNVPCSGQAALVAAINTANAAGGGSINLAPGCSYALSADSDANNPGNGLPVVMTPIGVNGNGATIDGTGTVRVFEVDGPGNLTLSNVTITAGFASAAIGGVTSGVGGGIVNIGGTVTVNRSQVTDNNADSAGGGIANGGGTVTFNQSRVTGNNAVEDGGGIASATFDPTSVAKITLNNSQVNGNTASMGGGGGILNAAGTATLNSSQVNGNTSLTGGGIASGNQGNPSATSHLILNKSEVNGNTATAPFSPGEAPPFAAGGIANGGEAILNNSQVDNNTASHTSGAGIVNHGTMTLNKSEVNGNTAAGSNVLASGGGIINALAPFASGSAVLTLNHSQVNNNTAGGNGGGISNGLGSMLPGGPVTLNHSQVTGNRAAHGGGIFNSGGTVTLSHSTVTGNHPDNCEPPNSIPGCVG